MFQTSLALRQGAHDCTEQLLKTCSSWCVVILL
jgi:hypothetical protein